MQKSPRKSIISFLGLSCGCRNSKSVSVLSLYGKKAPAPAPEPQPKEKETMSTSAESLTLTSPVHSTSSFWEGEEGTGDLTSGDTPASFSDLLRELNELEQSVVAWKSCNNTATKVIENDEREDDKMSSDERKDDKMSNESKRRGFEDNVVVVVKESKDPLRDFRRSMEQMIVEKEIVSGEGLQELLLHFLALNSRFHHEMILRAFTEVSEEVCRL